MNPHDIEGSLHVRLAIRDGRIADVGIGSTRPRNPGSVLEGRPLDDALALIPKMFSVCGAAQGLAAIEAAEMALSVEPAPAQRTARKMLLAAETIQQHGWRMLLDAPRMLGEDADSAALVAFHKPLVALPRLLFPNGDGLRLGGGRLAPDAVAIPPLLVEIAEAVETHILGPDWDNLDAWIASGRTAIARLLGRVRERGWEQLGRCDIAPLPALMPADLDACLAADRDGTFAARPHWQGAVHETGSLARQARHPRVAPWRVRLGNGLFTRLLARLVELAGAVEGLAARATALTPDPGRAAPHRPTGTGIGMIEAARGLLVHRLDIADGILTGFQSLAPTEWNFHPQGALARGLIGAPAENAPTQAEWLAGALDPCVACTVEVADA